MRRGISTAFASTREPATRPADRASRSAPAASARAPRARAHPLDEPTAIGDEALIAGLLAAMTREDLDSTPSRSQDEVTLVDASLADRIASERALAQGGLEQQQASAAVAIGAPSPKGSSLQASAAGYGAPTTECPPSVHPMAPRVMPLPPLARCQLPSRGAEARAQTLRVPPPRPRAPGPRGVRGAIATIVLSGCVLAAMALAVEWSTNTSDSISRTTIFPSAKE